MKPIDSLVSAHWNGLADAERVRSNSVKPIGSFVRPGVAGSLRPSPPCLSPAQRGRGSRAAGGRLAAGLLMAGLAVAAGGVAAGQGRTVWDGVYTAEQARRGAEAYEQACAECHGADLGGGDMAPGLAGVQFIYNWHGFSARDLFERLRVSMPPDQPNRVSRQEKADILAFMLEANGMPAGDTELASRTGPLGAIQFLAEP